MEAGQTKTLQRRKANSRTTKSWQTDASHPINGDASHQCESGAKHTRQRRAAGLGSNQRAQASQMHWKSVVEAGGTASLEKEAE